MKDDKGTTHLQIGVIARPHGVRGELKARLHFEGSTALWEASTLILEDAQGKAQRFEVESVRGTAKGPILALANVHSCDGAEALRGATIWVERSALPALSDGEYYLVDLVGCGVFCDGKKVGRVVSVRPDPSVDTMVLVLEDGSSAEMPIVDVWLEQVDVENKRVELRSLDGLIQ